MSSLCDCRAETETRPRSSASTESVAPPAFSTTFIHPQPPVILRVCVCVCVFQDTPLGSVFSQYLSRVSSSASRTVCFYFDGVRVMHSQTPAELDMEDGDMVEVWL